MTPAQDTQKVYTVRDAILDGKLDLKTFIEAERKPTMGEQVEGKAKTLGNALVRTVLTGNAGLMTAEAQLMGAVGLDGAARWLRDRADFVNQTGESQPLGEPAEQMANQGLAGRIGDDVMNAAGSVAGSVLVPGVGKMGTATRAATQGALIGFGQGFYEAKGHGADETAAWMSGLANAGLGASEGIPWGANRRLAELLQRSDAATGGGLRRALNEAIKGGLTEVTQEGLQQIGSNVIAQQLYEGDRELLEGVVESGRGGGLVGLFLGALTGARARGRQGVQPTSDGVQTPSEPSVAPDSGPPEGYPGTEQDAPPTGLKPLPVPFDEVSDTEGLAKPAETSKALAEEPSKEPADQTPIKQSPATIEDAELVGSSHGQKDVVIRAKVGDKLVGYATLAETADAVHGQMVEVGEKHRRQGIGTQLVRAAEAYAKSQGKTLEWSNTTAEGTALRSSLESDQTPVKQTDVEPTPLEPKAVLAEEAPAAAPLRGDEVDGGGATATPATGTLADTTTSEGTAPTEAASPAEVETVFGIRNSAIDEDVERFGLRTPSQQDVRTWESLNERAATAFEADAEAGAKLVEKLEKTSRAPSDLENMVLLRERTRLGIDFEAAANAYFKAAESGAPTADLKAEVDRLSNANEKLFQVLRDTGTESGRSLAARAAAMREDYSLASLEIKARIANEGQPLEKSDLQAVKELHDKIQEAQKYLDDYQRASNTSLFSEVAQSKVDESANQAAEAKKQGKLLSFLDEQADAARARIKARSTTAAGAFGVDPFLVADYAIVGASKLAHGIVDAAAWAKSMTDDFGEDVRPMLDEVRAKAEEIHNASPRTQSRLKAYKTRLRSRESTLRKQLAEDSFEKRASIALPLDEEALGLKARVDVAKRAADERIREIAAKKRNLAKKALDAGQELIDINRDLIASVDFSAFGIQGLFNMVAHPIRSAGNAADSFRAFGDEMYALKTDARLRDPNRPGYAFERASGLVLSDIHGKIGAREEFYRSKLLKKVPLIGRSNRAFTTFVNLQRVAAFQALVRAQPGKITIEQGKNLAFGVNALTGRGSIKSAEGFLNEAGRLLWSPRLFLSSIQTVMGVPALNAAVRGDTATAIAFGKEYARFAAGMAAIYGLASIWFDVEWDREKSSFLDITSDDGQVHVNPMGRFAQTIAFLSKVVPGGEVHTQDGRARETEAADVFRFFRNKLTPTLGLAADYKFGDFLGNEPELADLPKKALMPMSIRAIIDAFTERGWSEAAALSAISALGVKVNIYRD